MTSLRYYVITIFAVLSLSSVAQTTEMETRFNVLSARFDVRDKLLLRDLKTYLQEYPYTTFADEVKFMQGVLQAEKGQYKQSLKFLEQVEMKSLTRDHQTDYTFYRGYGYLMMQDYHRAGIYFSQLSRTESRYTSRATYYAGYCLYKEEKYDKALPIFKSLESKLEYAKTVPYFLTQIYYVNGDYEEAASRAQQLLSENPDGENNTELHRMLGEMYYLQGDYSQAVEHLGKYHKVTSANKMELIRNDLYMLGSAHYRLGNYAESVKFLKQVKRENDTISEATCLTMGNAYVQLKQPEQAKLSYQAAANFGLTPALTEEAAYNYTLCTYQSSSALGESVRAFNDFLHQFPGSKYDGQIYRLLSDALVESKNYASAIAILDSLPNPTQKMIQTKQYLRYQLGADNFLQGKMKQSVEWMTQVIQHDAESSQYTSEAYYVRAEANYRLRSYKACESDLKTFFARSDGKQSKNYAIARYLQGYCYFSQKQYDKAREAFSQYIDVAVATEPTYPDALNRIGDSYFNARQFDQAISYYGQVSNMKAAGTDYALFQRGYALGLQHKYSEKINVMQDLLRRYPKSDYADDGLYEIARAQLQKDDEHSAIATYEDLLKKYPNSSLARKASLERAMLFRNLHQNEQAIEAYRQTIDKYPATEEAYTALDALQILYVEQNNVSEYVAYTKQLAKMNMKVTTQEDSLLYAAAEMQYMQASYQKAIAALTNYVTQYCAGGRYCTTAHYYLADSYDRVGMTTEALAQYNILAELNSNPYQEEASLRAAEICYEKGDYTCALEGYYHLLSLASTHENLLIARLGVLRCSRFLNRYSVTIDVAEQLLNDSPDEDTQLEALYSKAKAYVAQNQWSQAQADLQTLSAEVRTAEGAEAKYLLAQSYFELKNLDAAEAEVMSFTQMKTTQQYWLARALILLSEINRERGELFQARQYLLVLQQNYMLQTDDIHTIITDRLAQLDQLEQPVVTEETKEED